MITGANRRFFRWFPAVAAVVTAFLASGCLWGVVRDAETEAAGGPQPYQTERERIVNS